MIQHIKVRWLSLYSSIYRLLLVYEPVKDYFTHPSNKGIPAELKKNFESEETLCVLTFLQHVLFEIQKSNLELQKEFVTAVDLHRIITSLHYKLKQRVDTMFFGIHCQQLLNRMPSDLAAKLQSSFVQFISTFLDPVNKYFSKNAALLEIIGQFAFGIENLSWDHVQRCIALVKIDGLNEDDLFNEFTELKLTFELIKKKNIPLADQIDHFLCNELNTEIRNDNSSAAEMWTGVVRMIKKQNKQNLFDLISCGQCC